MIIMSSNSCDVKPFFVLISFVLISFVLIPYPPSPFSLLSSLPYKHDNFNILYT